MSETTRVMKGMAGALALSAILACEPAPQGAPAPKVAQAQVAVADIARAPVPGPADEALAGAFAPLDGTWEGRFRIYVPKEGAALPRRPELAGLGDDAWDNDNATLDQSLTVRQVYVSESPLFQRVTITDTLESGEVIRSEGVNKVQDGQLWCVVHKPDDIVVHTGARDGASTLIWTRSRAEPQAIERFRETVEADEYRIIGWGVYGGADPEGPPTHLFAATYKRVAPGAAADVAAPKNGEK